MSSGAQIIVPILRSGVLAHEFCRRFTQAEVEAVFQRSFYLRSGDLFVCVGEPGIGNGPLTLAADLVGAPAMSSLGLCQGQPAAILDDRITIGDKIELTFERCVLWRQPPWPVAMPACEQHALCRVIARQILIKSPIESFGRTFCRHEADVDESPLARIAGPRIARFESWLRDVLEPPVELTHRSAAAPTSPRLRGEIAAQRFRCAAGEGELQSTARVENPPHPPAIASQATPGGRPLPASGERWSKPRMRGISRTIVPPSAVADLIGLGNGLTPSGDDFLVGALALLDALDERGAHAALARAIEAVPRGMTSPLSACLLNAAASGHVAEHLCSAVSAVISGSLEEAIAAVQKIGHGSGWDMMAGIATALRVATARHDYRGSTCALERVFEQAS
jgi:hypothetical protein